MPRLAAAVASLMCAALPGPAAGQLWTDAVPQLPLIRADPLEGLDMRCVGDGDHLTGCLMRDLYFDTKTGTFLFFGRKIDSRSGAADSQDVRSTSEVRRRFNEQTCVLSALVLHACPAAPRT